MKHTLKLTLALFTAALGLAFTACDGGGGGGSSAVSGPSAATGFPTGSILTFNPTITFAAGSTLTYVNETAGSPFHTAAAPGIAGSYTLVSKNAANTASTLTINLTGVATPIVLELSNYTKNSDDKVTAATITSGGRTFTATFSGVLPDSFKPASTGGGGGGGTTGLVNATADISASTQGTHELVFFNAGGGSKVSGSPHDAGDKVTFIIGARTLKVGSKTLSNPKNPSVSLKDFVYQDGNLWYWVYGERTPIQINLYGGINPTQSGTTFYGGFSTAASQPNPDPAGDADTAGTYKGSVTLNLSGLNGRGPNTPNLTNGTQVSFTISTDRKQISVPALGGKAARTLAFLPGDSSETSMAYSDKGSSPANHLTFWVTLDEDGDVESTVSFQYVENTVDNTSVHTTNYVISSVKK